MGWRNLFDFGSWICDFGLNKLCLGITLKYDGSGP